jgi:hypothetical protein
MDELLLSTTRSAWQALAEHVLSAALHEATGRIGLRARPGGFATPEFIGPNGSTRICVDGAELMVIDDDGERRAPISTLAAAGELVGVTPGAPVSVYTPTTPLAVDAPLLVDRGAAALLAQFFADVDAALEGLRRGCVAEAPAPVQLCPEHFDAATSISEVNYGGSPGDAVHPTPYLYVGPHTPPTPDGGFWNEPFGASLDLPAIGSPADIVTFFRQGRVEAAALDLSS